ncbi:DUF695 domain-containing protein [Dyadobacter sp. CY312]|uniref:DUF695 domain-containing protein n=1 Tax=Dyadobacter sp. CY312 TaxID=2907303 RepID=UPI001F3E25E3|nr:DUF695 domain-containing protein [Dyadobacter sp. CY312]MCE7041825.1 DUF695 domain-containing protein [Dyadobacter sp. CY312]
MKFLKDVFGKKSSKTYSNKDFWNWFLKNEKLFFKVLQEGNNIEKSFFDKLSPKLDQLREGFFYLTGMYDHNTAELVLTVDGSVKNIVFVEDLVNSAPEIKGWKFTALKPASDIKDASIEMSDYKFNVDNLSFYSNEFSEYPDEIDIVVVHQDFSKEDESTITNGTYIFIDTYLGELDSVTVIDNMRIVGMEDIQHDLVPIEKLKDFLHWRQKEFIEKYEGVRANTEEDNFSIMEAEIENGNVLIAVINTDLLNWDSKASHPWILTVEIKYDGENNNGMPDDKTYKLLEEIEDNFLDVLKDFDGYLNIGRQTSNNLREIFFACKDFRKPSTVANNIQKTYSDKIEIAYDIYKDKYWQSFERFNRN